MTSAAQQVPRLPVPAWAVVAIPLMLWLASTLNGSLAVYAFVVLITAFALLRRSGESSVLLFMVFFQWVQACAKLVESNLTEVPLQELAEFKIDISPAIWLSLTGLLVMAAGMRLGAGPAQPRVQEDMRVLAHRRPMMMWFTAYLAATGLGTLATGSAHVITGLSQVMLALASLKWGFYFLLTYVAFRLPLVERWPWIIGFLLELGLGIGGYFSDFKTVLFMTFIGMLASGVRITLSAMISLGAMGALAVVLSVVWSAVKIPYRDYINQGTLSQVVNIDYAERMTVLLDMVDELDEEKLKVGFTNTINRLSYVDFFASVLNYVPDFEPHTDGALWGDAVVRPFMPRLLFPEKSIIDDSARTNQFTGLNVSGAETGVSISIGYIGEAFIDFGMYLMMPVLLAFGWAQGRYYRWLSYESRARGPLGMGLASGILLLNFLLLETSITKSIGGFLVAVIAAWGFLRYVAPYYLPWMLVENIDKDMGHG